MVSQGCMNSIWEQYHKKEEEKREPVNSATRKRTRKERTNRE